MTDEELNTIDYTLGQRSEYNLWHEEYEKKLREKWGVRE